MFKNACERGRISYKAVVKPCEHLEVTFIPQSSLNLLKTFVLMISWQILEMVQICGKKLPAAE